ncbi:MAG: hypothetical protein KAI47_11635, partial [Deltaproteobacteria bacterium]|nr:hypothetical protein [Deltaproteobacteria bacterium]
MLSTRLLRSPLAFGIAFGIGPVSRHAEAKPVAPHPTSRPTTRPETCTLRKISPGLRQLCRKLHALAATDPSTFAVGFVDLRDNQKLYIRPDLWMHAAST